MDHRPLAPTQRPYLGLLQTEPLDNFGRFSDYLSAPARRLVHHQHQLPGLRVELYRFNARSPWFTTPNVRPALGPEGERRVLTCIYLGLTVTGPIQDHHLRHFAGLLNQATASGVIEYAAFVPPFAMPLARRRFEWNSAEARSASGTYGSYTDELPPERHILVCYAYAADPARAQELSYTFDEGGLPADFPEHLYATPLRSDREPEAPTPRGYWRRHRTRALAWAILVPNWLYAGWNLAELVDKLLAY